MKTWDSRNYIAHRNVAILGACGAVITIGILIILIYVIIIKSHEHREKVLFQNIHRDITFFSQAEMEAKLPAHSQRIKVGNFVADLPSGVQDIFENEHAIKLTYPEFEVVIDKITSRLEFIATTMYKYDESYISCNGIVDAIEHEVLKPQQWLERGISLMAMAEDEKWQAITGSEHSERDKVTLLTIEVMLSHASDLVWIRGPLWSGILTRYESDKDWSILLYDNEGEWRCRASCLKDSYETCQTIAACLAFSLRQENPESGSKTIGAENSDSENDREK